MTEKKIPISSGDEDSGSEAGGTEDSSNGSASDAFGDLKGPEESTLGDSGDAEVLEGLTAEEDAEMSAESRDADFSLLQAKKRAENEGSEGQSAQDGASKEELDEVREKYLRALAEAENVKKRAAKERSELLKYQGERVFVDLLEVADNFERALEAASQYELSQDGQQLQEGVKLIRDLFQKVLDKWQVRGESGVGKPFDPQWQEAISQMPSADHPAGTVLNELEKAYYYKDKLIRAGKVVVSTQPAVEEEREEG